MHSRTSPILRATALALAAGLAGAAGHARAQAPMPGHGGTGHGATAVPSPKTPVAPGSQRDHAEMMAAMERMNCEMMAPQAMTGDPDRDLVAMMIPHHQGAIDMARIYLRTGRDRQIRRMAQKIIADPGARDWGETGLAGQAPWPGPVRSRCPLPDRR